MRKEAKLIKQLPLLIFYHLPALHNVVILIIILDRDGMTYITREILLLDSSHSMFVRCMCYSVHMHWQVLMRGSIELRTLVTKTPVGFRVVQFPILY